jgi:hypothetical protein
MKNYSKPEIKSEKFFIHASGQYVLVITPEDCPGLVNNPAVRVEESHFVFCDDFSNLGSQSDDTYILTCSNFSGSFTISTHLSEASLGGGLNCEGGDDSIILPFTLSPDLPEDCVVNSLQLSGSSSDPCIVP